MIRKKLKEVLSIMMCCLLCFSTFASAAYEETDTGDFYRGAVRNNIQQKLFNINIRN